MLLAGAVCAGLSCSPASANPQGPFTPDRLRDVETGHPAGATLNDICVANGQLSVMVDRPALPAKGARVLIDRKPYGLVAALVPGPKVLTAQQAAFELDRLIERNAVQCPAPMLTSPLRSIGVVGLTTVTQSDGSQRFEFTGAVQ
jgi:hypothetical protein